MTMLQITPKTTALTIRVEQGPVLVLQSTTRAQVTLAAQGVQGPPGEAAESIAKPCAANILAGQVVKPNIAGALVLAVASSANGCKGAMLAKTAANTGFAASIAGSFLALADWTASTGAQLLTPTADYFLSPTTPGMLTTVVPTTAGHVVLHIGTAIDTTTMRICASDAIAL